MSLLNGLLDNNAPLQPISTNLKGLYNGGVTTAGAVASWTDLSGNNNHWTQPTSGNRPISTANQQNGKSALLFVGASAQHLLAPSGLLGVAGAACTQYLICKRNTDSVLQIPFNMGGANPTEQAIFFNAPAGSVSGTNDPANTHNVDKTGVTTTNYNIYILSFDGVATTSFQVNNGASTTAVGAACTDITDGFIGCRRGLTFPLTGGVAALAIYNTNHSAQQIAQNLTYFNSYWKIY